MSRLPEDLERLLHDLRGPLNALSMHAEVLKRAVRDDDPAAPSVKTVQQEAERLADMLVAAMSIIALERTESRSLSLGAVVEQALVDTQLQDVVVTAGAWPEVIGDAPLLALAVAHLVRNAVEATEAASPGTRRPEVSAERAGNDAVLVVRDYGIGLRSTNPKVLIRLRSSTKAGHQGLGLVTAERVVRLHGGTLTFDAPGQGARVTLRLPVADRA